MRWEATWIIKIKLMILIILIARGGLLAFVIVAQFTIFLLILCQSVPLLGLHNVFAFSCFVCIITFLVIFGHFA